MEAPPFSASTPSSLEQESTLQDEAGTSYAYPPLQRPPSAAVPPLSSSASSANAVARGGPFFVPGFVSHVVNARKFQGSCVTMLLALQAELDGAGVGDGDDDTDLLVDDLKIISDEDIVNSAMEKVLQRRIEELGHGEAAHSKPTSKVTESEEDRASKQIMVVNQDRADGRGEVNACGTLALSTENGACLIAVENEMSPNKVRRSGKRDLANRNVFQEKGTLVVRTKKRGQSLDRASVLKTDEVLMVESFARSIRTKRDELKGRAYSSLESLRAKAEETAARRGENYKSNQPTSIFVSHLKTNDLANVETNKVPVFEVLFWVQVYGSNTETERKKNKAQDFLVLGSQLLTDLRDKIYCVTDELMRRACTYAPSGYFLIESVFYNDLRDPQAIDYSFPILEWMNRRKLINECRPTKLDVRKKGVKSKKIPSLKAADMACTQFLDVDCHLGMRYEYCHQGDCKHALVVRDMRLVHKDDAQNMLLYPMFRSQLRAQHRKCTICGIYRAKRVTYDDKMAPSSPCFFCDYCYYLLHYTQDGKLLYNEFKVYDYYPE